MAVLLLELGKDRMLQSIQLQMLCFCLGAHRFTKDILSNCLSFTLYRCSACVCVYVCMTGLPGRIFINGTHIWATLCFRQRCVLIHVYWLLIATISVRQYQILVYLNVSLESSITYIVLLQQAIWFSKAS